MTVFIIHALILILSLFLFSLFASWIDKFNGKRKEKFIAKAIDKVSSVLTSNIETMLEQYETGPWYLAVYIKEAKHPIWISNNTIRSVHPDAQNRKLVVKQFNGEDMVIENVENYEMLAANELCDYDM